MLFVKLTHKLGAEMSSSVSTASAIDKHIKHKVQYDHEKSVRGSWLQFDVDECNSPHFKILS